MDSKATAALKAALSALTERGKRPDGSTAATPAEWQAIELVKEALQGYQGWANYETWAVNLWLTNDGDSYNNWRAAARHWAKRATGSYEVKQGIWTARQAALFKLAHSIKSHIGTDAEKAQPDGLLNHLLSSAVQEVDWHEIANELLKGTEEYEALPDTKNE